jgi:hypothetical protein
MKIAAGCGRLCKLPNCHLHVQVEPVLTVSVVVGRLGPTVSLLQTRVRCSPALVPALQAWAIPHVRAAQQLPCAPMLSPAHAVASAVARHVLWWCCAVGGVACGAQHKRPLHSDHDQQGAMLQEALQDTLRRNAGCFGQHLVHVFVHVPSRQDCHCARNGDHRAETCIWPRLQVRWRDAAEDASPDSQNGSDASSITASEQQSDPSPGGSENSGVQPNTKPTHVVPHSGWQGSGHHIAQKPAH